jgi:hypothetical protein
MYTTFCLSIYPLMDTCVTVVINAAMNMGVQTALQNPALLDMMAYTYNPSTQKAEAGGLRV